MLYLCFVIVSVSVYNVFVLCIIFLGSTLVQAVPSGATKSSLTNQINDNNNNCLNSKVTMSTIEEKEISDIDESLSIPLINANSRKYP